MGIRAICPYAFIKIDAHHLHLGGPRKGLSREAGLFSAVESTAVFAFRVRKTSCLVLGSIESENNS